MFHLRKLVASKFGSAQSGVQRLGAFSRFYATEAEFDAAQSKLKTLTEEPDNLVKLQLYGLFKQASSGDATGDRPGALNFVARAKYDAWNSHKGLSKEDARTKYISLVDELAKSAPPPAEPLQPGQVAGLQTGPDGLIYNIRFNRPEKFNAITPDMYYGMIDALKASDADKSTKITVFSAAGNYYSSGNDLSSFLKIKSPADLKPAAEQGAVILENFVSSFIDHGKPLIALVQGPAIGIAVTTLSLFDVVICSDQATFQTPFTSLGYSPEGCSSYTFPATFGPSKASEMLILGKTITAKEAYDWGLVSRVLPASTFASESKKILENICQLPAESLRVNKTMVRDVQRDILHKTNKTECKLLAERWQGKDCADAVKKFMTRKQ